MIRTLCCLLAFGAIGLALESSAPAAEAAKINVLLIDGQNNHDWKATTPVIKEMLEKTGRFNVEVLTSPPKGAPAEQWAAFKPDFSKYGVVFSNYNGQPWPEEVNKAFEKYMENGGGLVVYHAANNAFTKWEAWTKGVGLLWQKAGDGDRVVLDDSGKVVRTPKGEGPGAGHGPQHPYECVVRDPEHPVTKGLPAKFMHVKDELYQGQRGPAENMYILVTAWADPAKKGTGAHEPLAWTVPWGKGRVFVNLLGHDGTSVADPACTALMVRGTEWAATGAVTIPPPADLAASPATK
jgi:type 1 glutamine amidotransferase